MRATILRGALTLGVIVAAVALPTMPAPAAPLAPSVGSSAETTAPSAVGAERVLVIRVELQGRTIVPVGTRITEDWGDTVIERGSASLRGELRNGTFLRRALMVGPRVSQDVVQFDLPRGTLLLQGPGLRRGPDTAAVLGGTGAYAGARGVAEVTYGPWGSVWTVRLVRTRTVDTGAARTLVFPRELLLTRRIALGSRGSTVGNLTKTEGRLTLQGQPVAAYVSTSTVVRDLPQDLEQRMVQANFVFDKGTLMVNGMIVAPKTTLPSTPTLYVISGGTGIYAGAAGSAVFMPEDGDEPARWAFTLYGRQARPERLLQTRAVQQETYYQRTLAAGIRDGAPGDLIGAGGDVRSPREGRGRYAVSAQVVDDRREGRKLLGQTLLSFVEYGWGTKRILVAGLTATGRVSGPKEATTRAVIGGTGAFVGASGQVVMKPLATGRWRTDFQLNR